MFNLPLALLELQRGNCTISALMAEIEEAIGSAKIDAKFLLEQLETSPIGHAMKPEIRLELSSCILNAETARLTRLRVVPTSEPPPPLPVTESAGSADADATRVTRGDEPTVGIGARINNRFVLEEEIGRGGMSKVFKALDTTRQKAGSRFPYVALKVMAVNGVDFRSAFVAMQREAERSQRLNHPGIVRVHDFAQDESIVYTTMELLSGKSLSHLIREAGPGGIPDATASEYINGIAEALGYAHGKGIVHADLKPNNVIITDEGEVKVIDFGIARAMPRVGALDQAPTVVDARLQLGAVTPGYASLEMLRDGDPDPRDDLYSLGCVAYELYAARHPFGGIDAVRARDNGLEPRRPDGLSQNKWDAIVHALAFERDRRSLDIKTFLAEFNRRDRQSIVTGEVIKDRFVLIEEIGDGGMSRVFKALDRRKQEAGSRDPYVALKLMWVQSGNFRDGFVAMQREAQRCQQLNHPGIVRIYDFDADGELVFLTMELLEGRTLAGVIEEAGARGVPRDEAERYVSQIGEALAHAHDRGVVHADLKPKNVFVNKSGDIKLIDFGIARVLPVANAAEDDRTMFDARLAMGALSPPYASPEMCEGVDPDPRDDVYSLACTAYEIFSGARPFPETALLARAEGLEPKHLERLTAPQWAAIRHGLALERSDRTPDARTFLSEFSTNTQPRRRRVALLAAAAAVAVGFVAAGAIVLLPDQRAPASSTLRDCLDCPLVRVVAPGTFTLGLPEGNRSRFGGRGFFEYPDRPISIPTAFAMGVYEVTVGEFRTFAEGAGRDFAGCRTAGESWALNSRYSWSDPGFEQTDAHPVTCVSWNDAQAYVEWLSVSTGQRYRLPSEAEWEFVARHHAGLAAHDAASHLGCDQANVADQDAASQYPGVDVVSCSDGHARTAPVDRLGNAKFSDLLGNVFEWAEDCWVGNYDGLPDDGSPRRDGNCSERVLRGGSWFSGPQEVRPTFRNRFDQDYRSNTFGFRVVREENNVSD